MFQLKKDSLTSSVFKQDSLFVDPTFPLWNEPGVQWKRPKEICAFPHFIVDGATRMDVCQGMLKDCWFLSAVASVSLHPALLNTVVPAAQNFNTGYTGCFCFRFWQYGEWVEVKVDDRLPTQSGQLIFLHSSQGNEFWSALLEKAYAKLKGGYSALSLGFPHEALVDMSGGVSEVFRVSQLPPAFTSFLHPLLSRGALVNCANTTGALEQKNGFGIVFQHAYTVTGLETVRTKFGPVELVRVRNPWGKEEWQGPWSDSNGPEWNMVSDEEQKRVERCVLEDGEFWMSVSDFRQSFDVMEVCHLSTETLSEGGAVKPWHCTTHHGCWEPVKPIPQFSVTLLEEDDDPTDPELTCSFLLALMQKHTRQRGVMLHIALNVYKVDSECVSLSSWDLSSLHPVLTTDYLQRREVVIRGCLAPGHYIIVPSTYEPRERAEFLLRVLTEKGNRTMPAKIFSADKSVPAQSKYESLRALPSDREIQNLFKKHCNKKGMCRAVELYKLLTEALRTGVLAGSEKKLSLEHCKSFVVLMDTHGVGQLDATEFQALWDKFKKWTQIFLTFDKNMSQSLDHLEISPALVSAGLQVDEFILQLIALRYTEPDMTVSYPGFLYLLCVAPSPGCFVYTGKFKSFDMVGAGTVTINYRQWLYMTMYN